MDLHLQLQIHSVKKTGLLGNFDAASSKIVSSIVTLLTLTFCCNSVVILLQQLCFDWLISVSSQFVHCCHFVVILLLFSCQDVVK